MIIIRAPLRISFVGGGTDLPDFYRKTSGKVISATIDKYVYVAINPAPLLKGISARYSEIEDVLTVKELKNSRIREAMLELNVHDKMEIGVFSDIPSGSGLGGSSSLTVGLVKGLSTFLKQRLDKRELAEKAFHIELNRIKDSVGKQDHYAATFGGFNIFQFNPDESVDVNPILIDFKTRMDLEKNMIIFFTGTTKNSNIVLSEQKSKTITNEKNLKKMAGLVQKFQQKLLTGNFISMGELLHENWILKKKLASKISNKTIDALYNAGIKEGAWGGKVLGAGGGGCIMFLVSEKKKANLREAILEKAKHMELNDFKELPVKFVHTGVEIISNTHFN